MALQAGSITIAADGTATGTGLSLAIFNGALQALDADARARVANAMKPFCEGVASAIVTHLVENAEVSVRIETTDVGLQRTPNPNNPSTDTAGPSAQKTLRGTIT